MSHLDKSASLKSKPRFLRSKKRQWPPHTQQDDSSMKRFVLRSYLFIAAIYFLVETYQAWYYSESLQAQERLLLASVPLNRVESIDEAFPSDQKRWQVDFRSSPGKVDRLPNTFLDDQLYLLGARLTTSYEKEDESVAITVFGFPGRLRFPRDSTFYCDNDMDRQLWPRYILQNKFQLYTQLECVMEGNTTSSLCGDPTPMPQIETMSWDINADTVAMIWQLDITHIVRKHELAKESMEGKWIRLNLWGSRNQRKKRKVATVAIPLRTGTVGHVGPTHSSKHRTSPKYFSEPTHEASVCAATFGEDIQRYIPDFVKHHLNMGFGKVILGILDYNGTQSVLKKALKPYLKEGKVVWFPASAPGLNCQTKPLKIMFYNACLYYAKAISKYVGVWDVDEFWLPPNTVNEEGATMYIPDQNSTLARNSNPEISRSPIAVAMANLTSYHSRHGCEDWCFHGFPSYTVHLKQNARGGDVRRKRQISADFARRDLHPNRIWLKSIARTNLAFSAGFHEFGSCKRYQEGSSLTTTDYYNPGLNVSLRERPYDEEEIQCRSLRLNGFGNMHHFKNLITKRAAPNLSKDKAASYPRDEYVMNYAKDVEAQLLRDAMTTAKG